MDEAFILMDYHLHLVAETLILMDYPSRLMNKDFSLMDYSLSLMDEASILVDYLLRLMDGDFIPVDYPLSLMDEDFILLDFSLCLMDFLFIHVSRMPGRIHQEPVQVQDSTVLRAGRRIKSKSIAYFHQRRGSLRQQLGLLINIPPPGASCLRALVAD